MLGGLWSLALPHVTSGSAATGLLASPTVVDDVKELVNCLRVLAGNLVDEIITLDARGEYPY